MSGKDVQIRAGELRHQAELLRPEYVQDLASGEVKEAGPYVVDVVACEIEPMTGRELWSARQTQPDVTHRVCLRYRPDVDAGSCFRFKGRILRVLECLNIQERNRKLELRCVEQAGGV